MKSFLILAAYGLAVSMQSILRQVDWYRNLYRSTFQRP
jgi:hypothetical protein